MMSSVDVTEKVEELKIEMIRETLKINAPRTKNQALVCTAHGIYLSAVNEMLVQSDGKGKAVCEVQIKEGNLVDLQIVRTGRDVSGEFEVWFRNHKI